MGIPSALARPARPPASISRESDAPQVSEQRPLLTGPLLNRALDYFAARQDRQAQIALKEIEAEMDARRAAREIRLATAGFWEMRLLTFLIALPFVIHVNLVGADTNFQLGWGIPAFPKPFDEWEGAILLSFFGIYTVGRSIGAIAGALARRQ